MLVCFLELWGPEVLYEVDRKEYDRLGLGDKSSGINKGEEVSLVKTALL